MCRRLLASSAPSLLLTVVLSALFLARCGSDGSPGPTAVALQTLAAQPPIVRPGCLVTVTASLSDPLGDDVSLDWATDAGALVETAGATATVRAPALEELTRLPSGFTVEATVDAGPRGRAVGRVGVVVDRRLGAPCDD